MMNEIKNGWFTEQCTMWPGCALSVKIEKCLYKGKSKFQEIEVYQTANCGRMLVLDGMIQLTESDEFAYQEMLTHLPLFSHPNPKHVLVIGGGDGGVLREIAKHECVETIDICEIDEEVIHVSKKFLPFMACGFEDPRVKLHIEDGNEFIKRQKANGIYFDVIIVDSSDPIGPAEVLFEKPFYIGLRDALTPEGIIATQGESFFMHKNVVKNLISIVSELFPVYGYSAIFIPTYPGGNIGICMGSLKYDIKNPIRTVSADMQKELKYYNPDIHKASFVLPQFAAEIVQKNNKTQF